MQLTSEDINNKLWRRIRWCHLKKPKADLKLGQPDFKLWTLRDMWTVGKCSFHCPIRAKLFTYSTFKNTACLILQGFMLKQHAKKETSKQTSLANFPKHLREEYKRN